MYSTNTTYNTPPSSIHEHNQNYTCKIHMYHTHPTYTCTVQIPPTTNPPVQFTKYTCNIHMYHTHPTYTCTVQIPPTTQPHGSIHEHNQNYTCKIHMYNTHPTYTCTVRITTYNTPPVQFTKHNQKYTCIIHITHTHVPSTCTIHTHIHLQQTPPLLAKANTLSKGAVERAPKIPPSKKGSLSEPSNILGMLLSKNISSEESRKVSNCSISLN